MHIEHAKVETLRNIRAGNATMWVSGSGMGKSSGIYQLYQQLSASAAPGTWGFGLTFCPTMSPIDSIGVPFKGERKFTLPDGTERSITVTDPTVPLWQLSIEGKPAFMYKYFFLFFDEYGQGNEDFKRGASEIMLSGGTSYWSGPRGLPPGSVRIAATNQGSRYGVTRDFDFAVARRSTLHITGDVKATTKFWDYPYEYQGKTWQTLPFTKAWADRHPDILFEAEPKEQGPWCHPRSALMADRYLQEVMADHGGTIPINDVDAMGPITEMIVATAGQRFAQSYTSELQFLFQLPSYDEVVKDPDNTAVPSKADLILLMVYELAGRVQKQDLGQVLKYVGRFKAKDMEIAFVSSLLRRDYNAFIHEPAMKVWSSKNSALVNVIAALTQ